jgi:hypothetical protein
MRLVVPTKYPSVTDRGTASLLGAKYLEAALLGHAESVEIDLNGNLRQLSVGAADELVGKFVERLRGQAPGAAVLVRARSWDVLRNVHAALRDRSQAALAVNDQEPSNPIPVGDVSVEERNAYQELIQGVHLGHVEHLQSLATKGLLVATADGYVLPDFEQAVAEIEYA